jgi:hypothetical protein
VVITLLVQNDISLNKLYMKRALQQAFKPKTMFFASSPDKPGQAMRQLSKK